MDNKTNTDSRTIALITGACGGMGRMCARLLGTRHQLALIDVNQDQLNHNANELRRDGYTVAINQAVDISDQQAVNALAQTLAVTAPLGAIAHTAGLSPAQAPWDVIMKVNLLGTVYLLDALLPLVGNHTAAVCIASIAGHQDIRDTSLQAVLDAPLADNFLAKITPYLDAALIPDDKYGRSSGAYGFSKYAVIRLVEQRAKVWAEQGGRIVSVSPGMIDTPMGNKELSENPLAAGMFEHVPTKRLGTALDIANAVDFLCSERANFINGTDLRIDFGTVATMKHLPL